MNDENRWHILQSKMKRNRASELIAALEDRGVEAVLIKGAAVARFYPPDLARPSIDIDLAVDPQQFDIVTELLRGGELGPQDVDLHKGLRHFDKRDWSEVYAKTKVLDIEGSRLRVLSEEDQLRVTCIHWLADGGERKERLRDIYYLVKNRPAGFDWDYALDANGPVRRGWVVSAIGIAHRFLDLDIESLPFAEEARNLPEWLPAALENRWNDTVKFEPLDNLLRDPVNLLRQLRRRFPPNPIMSTIMTEGVFDSRNRLRYQVSYFAQRAGPSLKRSLKTLLNLLTGPK